MSRIGDWIRRFRDQNHAEFTEIDDPDSAPTRIAIDCYTTLQGRYACNFTLESDTSWHVYLIILDLAPTKAYILCHPELWHFVRSFPRVLSP